ncbi:hypothetical protein I2I05_17980 [Hymenobacter sp. BT683]|uniref:MAE-28990/MAE-18760-like HEPN domain-containing protein n=1 Tax=Hymenobacter jeongseonensis TaxID=2791027 RepID=A0ABS0ILR2_9BACT|nr:hypothetical protein [Hymenobacter jeongseonensis]MBF9239286.1 hypothetical protein [Hymenobacter jeongseonensis]
MAYYLSEEKQAIAIDLLATMFQILSESTKRLEGKISDISLSQGLNAMPVPKSLELHTAISLLDYKREPEQLQIRTALAEAWTIIDYAHRVGELLPLARVNTNKYSDDIFERIRLMRNSYHHTNERIENHFLNGGSVFGNLTWQFMDAQKTAVLTLFPSVSPNEETSGNFETSKGHYATTAGISMVKLHFVIKKSKTVLDEELRLDDVAALINNIIERMESHFQQVVDWANAKKQEHEGTWEYSRMPPSIMVSVRNNEDTRPD